MVFLLLRMVAFFLLPKVVFLRQPMGLLIAPRRLGLPLEKSLAASLELAVCLVVVLFLQPKVIFLRQSTTVRQTFLPRMFVFLIQPRVLFLCQPIVLMIAPRRLGLALEKPWAASLELAVCLVVALFLQPKVVFLRQSIAVRQAPESLSRAQRTIIMVPSFQRVVVFIFQPGVVFLCQPIAVQQTPE